MKSLIPNYKFKEFCTSKVYLDYCKSQTTLGKCLEFDVITDLYFEWIKVMKREEKLKSLGI